MGQNHDRGINCPKCRSFRNVICEGTIYECEVWTQYRCGGCNVLFAMPKKQADKILNAKKEADDATV